MVNTYLGMRILFKVNMYMYLDWLKSGNHALIKQAQFISGNHAYIKQAQYKFYLYLIVIV